MRSPLISRLTQRRRSHLWPLIDVAVDNRVLEPVDELGAVLGDRIRVFGDRPEQVRSTTLFGWWPTVESVFASLTDVVWLHSLA